MRLKERTLSASPLKSGHALVREPRPLCADSVEKGRQESVVIGPDGEPVEAASPIYAVVWAGIGISFAIFRRFWAVAARMNSSLAPFGPRSLRRSSLRIRLR